MVLQYSNKDNSTWSGQETCEYG